VKVGGSAPHPALLVDDAAINTDQDKKFVFVVDQQGRVSYREVQQGMQHGNRRVIVSGLAAGDRVIVNGTQRAPGRAGQAAHGADDGRRRSVRAARGRREAGRTGEGGIVSGTPLRFPRSTRQSHP
jgi:hypothetical protein